MKKSTVITAVIFLIIGLVGGFTLAKYIGSSAVRNYNNCNNVNETQNSDQLNTIISNETMQEHVNPKTEEQNNKIAWLKTEGANLLTENGEKIALKGISSHGIQWFPEVLTYENIKELRDTWKINVFRIAMYTDPNANGYIAHPDQSKNQVKKIVEYAKQLDLYVIIDWHILNDNNPQIYQSQAIDFFDEMSKLYAFTPNVIYEICNEPNSNGVVWEYNVKPYAQEVIKAIRKNSPKSIVIVGTPDWSKDIKAAADSPIEGQNLMYSCHFYAGTHKSELRNSIDYCLNKNIPIFISECGITDASGAGAIYEESFNEWMEYIKRNNLSWIFWSFCNKDESSSVLRSDYPVAQNSNINSYLSQTGEIIKRKLQE